MNTLFKYIMCAVGILALAGMLASCSDEPETAVPRAFENDAVSNGKTGRSVLVYMLADNSLGADGYDRENLAEMIQAAQDGKLGNNRLVIYHDDRKASAPMLKEVTPSGLKILKVYENSLLSTDRRRMQEAIDDFKKVAPAEHYGLIFWSHATGWPLANIANNATDITPQWVGEDRGNYMDITDLSAALQGAGFDYVYFDCCHMASVEALYELRHTADWFVASAAELPAEGMPYYRTLPYLMPAEPDLVAAAKATYDKYDNLTGVGRTSTMSVINASALDGLADATRRLLNHGVHLPSDYTGQPFQRTSYGSPCYLYDFEDYIHNLQFERSDEIAEGGQLKGSQLISQWEAALSEAVVYQASTPWIFNTIKVDHHCGLTTFILRCPVDANKQGYCNLEWYTDVASHYFNTL